MSKITIDEFYQKVQSNNILKHRFSGLALEAVGEKIRVIKLPKPLRCKEGESTFNTKISGLLKSLELMLSRVVFYDPNYTVEPIENDEPQVIDGCIKFLGTDKRIPVPRRLRFRVDEKLFDEIQKVRAVNINMIAMLRNDLEYSQDLVLQINSDQGLISSYHSITKNNKRWIVDKSETIELSDIALQCLVLHINKKYKKAYRTEYLPTFEYFKESFHFGVSSENVEPLSENNEVELYFKSIRSKSIKGLPSPVFMSNLFYQEVDYLNLLIYDYENKLIQPFNKNREIVSNAINNYFNKIDSDFSLYIKHPAQRLKIIEMYSRILGSYYIKGLECDLDKIIVLNKKDNR